MARGNGIIVTPEPRGNFLEGLISGTPKPGTVVEIKSIDANGVITWEAAGTTANNSTYSGMAADGNRLPTGVLLCSQDHAACPLNQDATTAYADGDQCAVYMPIMGDRLNMILKDESGTGADQDFVRGLTKLIVDDGTGKLLASAGSPESEPFICLETVTDLAADRLTEVMFTGF